MSTPHEPPSDAAVMHYHSPGPLETQALGRTIGSKARDGDVIALIGDLGAGKTQLVRGIAEGLGVPPSHVSSPTFVLMQEYEAEPETTPHAPDANLVLVHIDAYRLEHAQELTTLGWTADTDGPGELAEGAVVVVEWADRVADALGPDRLDVHLVHARGTGRDLTITAHGNWQGRLRESDLPQG